MAFNIILQQNLTPKNQLTKDTTDLVTLSGILREDRTDIINPVVLVETDYEKMSAVNYASINLFSRSYFVTKIEIVRSYKPDEETPRMITYAIFLKVDVLSSFATEIRSNSAIIKRNENASNILLNDGVFKVKQNPYIVVSAFPSGFLGAKELILAMAGNAGGVMGT